MTIQFTGLATGLDTSSLISQLMQAEQAPITHMQNDKTWLQSRLTAFQQTNSKMDSLLSAAQSLESSDQYYKKTATTSSGTYFTASASNDALAGTSYQVEVDSLAQVQKSYTPTGFDSKTDQTFGTGTLKVTAGTTTTDVSIDSSNNSLEGIMKAINDANTGATASIIYNGSQYMLTLTGQDVATSFSLDSSGLSGGTTTIGTLSTAQSANQAHINVDGIDIYSNSNKVTDAIPGVTLNLLSAKTGEQTQVTIGSDNSALKNNLNKFVSAYNDVVSFIGSQSTMGDSSAGVLDGDASMNSIKRHLQDLLTTKSDNGGSIDYLSQLGLETQKDGTLSLNSDTFDKAVSNNFDDVVSVLAGSGDTQKGAISAFDSYLTNMTDSTTGFLQGRQRRSMTISLKSITRSVRRKTASKNSRVPFRLSSPPWSSSVSTMNAQSSYLSQQLSSIKLG